MSFHGKHRRSIRDRDYTKALDPNALQGKRIGVARFLAGYHGPTDAAFEQALAELRAGGAELVDIEAFPAQGQMSAAEFAILLAEFKDGLNAYLASTPADKVMTRTLDDLIAFNTATPAELEFFDQSLLEEPARAPALTEQAYLDAKATAAPLAGKDCTDKPLAEQSPPAISAPPRVPARPPPP